MATRVERTVAASAEPVDEPWELPVEWRWELLGDILERRATKILPDPKSQSDFVGLESILPETMHVSSTVPFANMRSAASLFKRGDILYSRLRPYLNKVWIADRDGACSGEFLVLTPRRNLISKYLGYYLHSHHFVHFASRAATGDRPRIDFDNVANFPIPVPSTGAQRRIVQRIEELFLEVSDGERALNDARASLGTYRKSLLNAAITGQLTAQWRATNGRNQTGKELLTNLLEKRRVDWYAKYGGRKSKYNEPTPLSGEDLPQLPDGWCWASGDQLSHFITKGTTPTKSDWGAPSDRTVPFIRVTNLTFGGRLNFHDRVFVSSRTHRGALARSMTLPGDVLMNIVGPPLGQVSIVPATFAEWNINQAIARFRPVTGYDPSFFALVLMSQFSRQWFEHRAKTTAGQVNLTLELCRRAPFPVPPLREQRIIVDAVERASDDLNDLIDDHIDVGSLRHSILRDAFSGKLAT